MAQALGVACHSHADAVLHEPGEVLKPDGLPYRVFTPYGKRWLTTEKPTARGKPKPLATPSGLASLPLPTLATWNLPASSCAFPKPGEQAAKSRLTSALRHRLPHYAEKRDHPHAGSTSHLSQDLRFGTISIRKVYAAACKERDRLRTASGRGSLEKFIMELAWREFYMQILAHFPEVLELEFNPDYRGLPWDEPGDQFEAWKAGMTVFPSSMPECESSNKPG